MSSAHVPAGRLRQDDPTAAASSATTTSERAVLTPSTPDAGQRVGARRLAGLAKALIGGAVVAAVLGDLAGRHADSALSGHAGGAGGAVTVRDARDRAVAPREGNGVDETALYTVAVGGAAAADHAALGPHVVLATPHQRPRASEQDGDGQSPEGRSHGSSVPICAGQG